MRRFFSAAIWLVFVAGLAACGASKRMEADFLANPTNIVGRHFEVARSTPMLGSPDFNGAITVQEMIKSGDAAKMMFNSSLMKKIKASATNLNQGSNSENAKVSLILKIIEFKIKDKEHSAVRVAVLNKKYAETKWWLSTTVLFEHSQMTPDPIGRPTVMTKTYAPLTDLKDAARIK